MKKILIIPSWYPSHNQKSAGVFFLKQAELLSKKFDVRIFIGREKLVGYRKLFQNFNAFINIKFKSCDYYLDILPDAKLYQFEYVNFTFISKQKRNERIEKTYFKYFSNHIFKSWKPDVIHAHDVFNGGIVAEKIRSELKIPFAITSHTPINYDSWENYKIKRFKQNIIAADTVIAVSNYDKRMLLNSIDKNINPVVLGNFIDEQQFTISSNKKLQNSSVNLLYIATTSKRKDFATLINAAHFLKKENLSFTLILVVSKVDDGITINNIQKLIHDAELEKSIKINDEVYFKDMPQMYNAADIYVSSSYFETFGVAVAEAMACGIPVVAADNGGVRDIIENGINGIIVPIKDAEALANGILKIIRKEIIFDPQTIRSSIVEKFGTDSYLKKLCMVYKQTIDRSILDQLKN